MIKRKKPKNKQSKTKMVDLKKEKIKYIQTIMKLNIEE